MPPRKGDVAGASERIPRKGLRIAGAAGVPLEAQGSAKFRRQLSAEGEHQLARLAAHIDVDMLQGQLRQRLVPVFHGQHCGRMTSLPAGRSLRRSDPIEESPPSSSISEAIENRDAARRATAMLGGFHLNPARQQFTGGAAAAKDRLRPGRRRHAPSTRWSSFERSSRPSKYSSGPYQRNAGETRAKPM